MKRFAMPALPLLASTNAYEENLKLRFTTLCGLMVLAAASLAPIVAEASCPPITVACSGSSKVYTCYGRDSGTNCVYDRSCLNGGKCGGGGGEIAPEEPINN